MDWAGSRKGTQDTFRHTRNEVIAMETVYATMITLLFGAWVWDLKGQVASMRQATVDGTPVAAPFHTEPQSRPVARRQHDAVRPTPPPSDAVAQGITRQNGVPTWVIN